MELIKLGCVTLCIFFLLLLLTNWRDMFALCVQLQGNCNYLEGVGEAGTVPQKRVTHVTTQNLRQVRLL